MAEYIQVGNDRIQVVSDEEAAKADFVVCCTADMPSPFTDNVMATCAFCATAIIHRPYMPKEPLKICIECAMNLPERGKGTH